MTQDIKPVRRIVTIDAADGASHAVQDGPSPDVRTDPARPGYASTRVWVTTASPPRLEKQFSDALLLPQMMEPPPHGSLCRIVTIPPDAAWRVQDETASPPVPTARVRFGTRSVRFCRWLVTTANLPTSGAGPNPAVELPANPQTERAAADEEARRRGETELVPLRRAGSIGTMAFRDVG